MVKATMFRSLAPLTLLLAFLFPSVPAYSAADGPHISLRLLADSTEVKAGDTITVGIEQTIEPGWHTYWVNPGDSGTKASISWGGLAGIRPGDIQWPLPKRLTMGPLTNFGFEGTATLLQDLVLPDALPDGPVTLTAKIDVLVCHDICIPESHSASVTLNGGQPAAKDALDQARAGLPVDTGWSSALSEQDGDLVVRVETDAPGAFSNLETIELYPEEWGLIDNTQATRADKDGNTLILRHKRGDRALSDVPVSKLVIAYNDPGGTRTGVRISSLSTAAAPQVADADAAAPGTNFWQAVLLAMLGGLVLNLMPCVFPILSMKALALVQIRDEDDRKARRNGIAYTAGILVCFAIIAGILIALKAGGMQVGWGFQLQHPAIILFLAYLFFTLGLNLAGYFEINFGLSNIGQAMTERGGMTGSFFTGVLATLVATPCTAPFMGVAMGYALTQSAVVAMAVFLALGLGLALPYLALSFIPAFRHVLPRPGAWMERFRQFLDFPLFASACWLLWVFSQQIDHMGQFAALLGMLAIAFGIWLWKIRPAHIAGHWLFTLTAIGVFAFTVSTFFTIQPMATAAKDAEERAEEGQNWENFSRAKLDDYLKDGDPVFVNMTAAWCITCKVNEKVALATKDVETLFVERKIRYLKGDWTNQNPEITHYLEEYGRSGVPIYVYYGPRDAESGARPEPVVLPQILTPAIVKNAITGD